MELINFLLNVVAWCLWAGAFVFPRYAVQSSKPLTLLSTLRTETPGGSSRLFFLGCLLVLLGLRAVAYWNFAPAGGALPSLDFGLLQVSLQKDSIAAMLCYSIGSFAVFLFLYYVAVVGLSVTCQGRKRVESVENLINQQIGPMALWHPGLKVAAMGAIGALLWIVLGLVLIRLDALPENWSWRILIFQSPILASGFLLTFLLVILGVIALHFLNSYVYLGEREMWRFVDGTARTYLVALRKLPLVVGRFDFAPIVGFLCYWLLYQFMEWGLRLIFERLSG